MSRQIVIPFGPQHPVLPEPIHLDLVMEDERVVDALPSIGYVHRGLEEPVEKRDYRDFVYIAERICGICSFIHGMTYCHAVEGVMDLDVPPRALYLRTVWSEPLASALAPALARSVRRRDGLRVALHAILAPPGARARRPGVHDGQPRDPGGVQGRRGPARRLQPEARRDRGRPRGIRRRLEDLMNVFVRDETVKHRLRPRRHDGTAGLGPRCGRPVLRGERGRERHPADWYAATTYSDFKPAVETAGDCYARTLVRAKGVFTSIDLIGRRSRRSPRARSR